VVARALRSLMVKTKPATLPADQKNFTITCALALSTYTVTATGIGDMNGFIFTINQANVRATTSIAPAWGSLPADAGTRWVDKKGG